MLAGLEWLHAQGVCHRDIKGANLLITKDGQVKLADFGVAGRVDASAKPAAEQAGAPVGTPYWMAPEIIRTMQEVSQPVSQLPLLNTCVYFVPQPRSVTVDVLPQLRQKSVTALHGLNLSRRNRFHSSPPFQRPVSTADPHR